MRSSSSPPAASSWRLSPRPPKGLIDPARGREIVLAIIKEFMKKYPVYEIIRTRHKSTDNTMQFELVAARNTLRVSSKQLERGDKLVEVINLELLALGDDVIDAVNVHIDNSRIRNLSMKRPSINKIWEAMMWSRDFNLAEMFCHVGWSGAGSVIADIYILDECEEPGW